MRDQQTEPQIATRAEWLEIRKSGIGASDAAVVLGYSPWKSNVTLWEEKTGRKEPDEINNLAIEYGNAAEPLLRSLFELDYPDYKPTFEPFKIIRNPDKPFIFATPDGELEDPQGRHGGLEIKTTEIRQSLQWKKWDSQVPDNYFVQVLHQMLATDWEFVILKAQIKHYNKQGDLLITTRHYHFERSDYIEDIALVEAEDTKFWECVVSNTRPNLKLPQI